MPLIEDYDRQQAFSAGFALAARDWGLSKDEYESFCKMAAQVAIPITDQKQADQLRVDNFVAEKAQAVKGQQNASTGQYAQNQVNAGKANQQRRPGLDKKGADQLPPAPPADDTPPMTPPGVSAFSPEAAPAVTAARNARLRQAAARAKAKPATAPRSTSPGSIAPSLGKAYNDFIRNP
jgi:hypothetical protein